MEKVAFISGANRGIGFETAKKLAQTGVKVVLGSRDLDKGEEAVKKFFESHDHLIKEVKDQFVRFTGVMVVELETARKKDEERDQKIQAIYEMTEKMSDLVHARFGYQIPEEGNYLESIDDWRYLRSHKEGN